MHNVKVNTYAKVKVHNGNVNTYAEVKVHNVNINNTCINTYAEVKVHNVNVNTYAEVKVHNVKVIVNYVKVNVLNFQVDMHHRSKYHLTYLGLLLFIIHHQ